MEDIEISYKITLDDYVRANDLLRRKSSASWRGARFYLWMAVFIFVVLAGYQQRYHNDVLWIVLLPPGGYFLFQAGWYLLPSSWYRIWLKDHYDPSLDMVHHARFSADRVTVTGKTIQWSHRWAAFQKVTEDAEMFVFFDGAILFIFAKRFFTPEQIGGLQALIRNRPGNEPS